MSEVRARRVEARRLPVIIAIAVFAVLAGVANATVKSHHAASIAAPGLSPSAINENSSANSSAWYCAGPLPLKAKTDASSLVITNLSMRNITAEVNVSQSTGAHVLSTLQLGPQSARVYALGHSRAAGFGAATVLVDTAAVGVLEVVHAPQGNVSAPCVTVDTNNDYVVGSSTKGGNNLALALFDPGATPAVANVTLLTESGPQNPPAFQGVPLNAGGIAVLNVGEYEPDHSIVSAVVTSTGGRIVAGSLEAQVFGKSTANTLVTGTPAASSNWYFSSAPTGPGIRQQFVVVNPSSRPLSVHLVLGGPTGSVSEPLSVPAGSSAVALPVPDTASSMRWAELTSRASSPFVVARQTDSETPSATTEQSTAANNQAATAPSILAPVAIGSGVTVSAPVVGPKRGWLVVGESDELQGEIVEIANLSAISTEVSIDQLGASPSTLARYGLTGIVIAAHGFVQVNLGLIYKHASILPTIVHATQNVLVGPFIYARGSSGSIGLSAPSAIPLD